MNYLHGLRRRLSGKDRAWWNYFEVRVDDSQIQVVERRIFGRDRTRSIRWENIEAVCFVDGGLGSDVFYVFSDQDSKSTPIQIPTESGGGQMFWQQLKQRGLFPESASEIALKSNSRGSQIWWPPRPGA